MKHCFYCFRTIEIADFVINKRKRMISPNKFMIYLYYLANSNLSHTTEDKYNKLLIRNSLIIRPTTEENIIIE